MEEKQSTRSRAVDLDMGECFCEVQCRHGHETRLFNIGRAHFVACDRCRTYISVGGSLMGGKRQENEDTWRRNRAASDARGSLQ